MFVSILFVLQKIQTCSNFVRIYFICTAKIQTCSNFVRIYSICTAKYRQVQTLLDTND